MAYDPDIIEAQWKPLDSRVSRGPQMGRQTRSASANPIPSRTPVTPNSSTAPGFADSWPTLAAAMQRYRQNVAQEFIHEVRACISSGIIRFDDRKRLAARAAELEIRPFDAQLLIACAIRQSSIDQGQTANAAAPRKPSHIAARSKWRQLVLLMALSVILDAILIWQMNH